MSWRRYVSLIRGLPGDSAFQRWMADRANRSLVDSSIANVEF